MEARLCQQATIPRGIRSLVLDDLDLDPEVARRLSPTVASRHHALPVAVRDRRVTVAMADPTDTAARAAIASDLGVEPCIVQGDRISIDRLVAELWCKGEESRSQLLAWAPAGCCVDEVRSYAEYLSNLLRARLNHAPQEATIDALVEWAGEDSELIILGKPEKSLCQTVFSGSLELMALSRLSVSTLVAQRPSWPLQRVLLVIKGDASDRQAMDWTLRLAEPSGARVTALAIAPPVPAMYHGLSRMEGGLAELLATDAPLGRQMRRAARRLVDGSVEGTLLLRQGSPEWEIRRELARGHYDLLVVAMSPGDGVRRWLLGDLAVGLTRVVDRPILVAR